MFIETSTLETFEAPKERNICLLRDTLRSSGAKEPAGHVSYKHLAALRPKALCAVRTLETPTRNTLTEHYPRSQ